MVKLAPHDICTACMACVDSCQRGALKVSIDSLGFYCIDADQSRCIECGLCNKVCPVLNSSDINKNGSRLPNPYAAWCTDDELRAKSASGGAFAAIARAFLLLGAVVYGAAIDGFEVKHRRIETIEKLPLLLGSKYQHSDMRGIYRVVKNDLKEGRVVLFSGLSCQCVGLFDYVGNKLRKNLYIIDTICGGLSTMLPMVNFEQSGKYRRIVSFRDKSKGWKSKGFAYALKLEDNNGNVCDLGKDNLVIKMFNCKLTKRSSCLDCRFNGINRVSDCTIGDFWGDRRFKEQHEKGLSVLVDNTGRIANIIQKSTIHLTPIAWNELIDSNPCYYWSHYSILRHSVIRKKILSALKKKDYDEVKRLIDYPSFWERMDIRIYYRIIELKRRFSYMKFLKRVK